MGGTTLAWAVVRGSLERGKHVVTANKALISMYMDDIVELLKAQPKARFMFEAAVCGGIPIINVFQRQGGGEGEKD